MLLRNKIAFISLGTGLIASLLLVFVWLPFVDQTTRGILENQTRGKLAITAEVLIPLMIEQDYANIYESLDALTEENPDWLHLTLHDGNGELIYPLSLPAVDANLDYLPVDHVIELRGETLGTLHLTSDLKASLEPLHTKNIQLLLFLVLGLFLTLGVILVLMERLVRRPSEKLVQAAGKIAVGDYSAKFNRRSRDEIGILMEAFEKMQTAIQEKEQSMQLAKEEAEAANKAKSDFVSIVSHELRTPLTAIRGALGLVHGGVLGALPKEAHDMIGVAENNTDRLISLVNDILDIAKLQAGKLDLVLEVVEMDKLLQEAVQVNQSYAVQHGVTFSLVPEPEPLLVEADHFRILQIMANLLSNAAKFSEKGTEVEISLEQSDGSAVVYVKDHGRGIPFEHQAALFDQFTQVDNTDARERGGTGLGLSICKTLVEMHNGEIGVESEPGKGSSFHFSLPLKNKAA